MDGGWVVKDDSPYVFTRGTAIRRVWLGATGNLGDGWSYTAMGGFSAEVVRLQDAFLHYQPSDSLGIRIGQQKLHSGFESEFSNNNLIFMDRASMTAAFRPRRAMGISFMPSGDGWGAALGIFSGNLGGQSPAGGAAMIEGRFFISPLEEHLHLGVNVNLASPDEAGVRIASRAEAFRPEENLVNTGFMAGVKEMATSGLEAVYTQGRGAIMAEWQQSSLKREFSSAETTLQGGYIAAVWSLTGESRAYNKQTGTLGVLLPESPITAGGMGAWEVALRRSYLDLTDGIVRGGRLDSTTLGLNWYPEDNLKFMANYQWHQNDALSRFPRSDPQFFLVRAQLTF